MKNYKLGKLKKIEDLNTIWEHEARDFTPWLAEEENLELLGDAIGVNLELLKTEERVGGFRVDILAKETETGRMVVIENQLEDTNHDHLGKAITYAAGKDASIIVWIVKNAREEHAKAIEWLNNHTGEDVSFFLIEIELWSIDGSDPAPVFNVVERPNYLARILKNDTEAESATKQLRLNYWTEMNTYASKSKEFTNEFRLHKPSTDSWYSLSIGKGGCNLAMLMRTGRKAIEMELYIKDDKELFRSIVKHKDEIEEIVGCELSWRELPEKMASRVLLTKSDINFSDKSNWASQFDWLMKYAILFKKAFLKFM